MTPTALALALGTLVSEDGACLAAGALIARGDLDPISGLAGCAIGIFMGDLGLWAVGRAGRLAAWRSRWIARGRRADRLRAIAVRLDQKAGLAILASRFVPGTRLPAYVMAGVVGVSLARFAAWCGLAVALWTPLIVIGTAGFGAGAAWLEAGRWSAAVGVLGMFGCLAVLRRLATSAARAEMRVRFARLRRWEFWPAWVFYPPVAAWVCWLGLRYGGLSTITAANPGMPDGGTVGESKAAILSELPIRWTIPHVRIDAGQDNESRSRQALGAICDRGWTFPVVLKPDVGQRGVDVKLATEPAAVQDYLSKTSRPVLMQPYHPGPFEAGVFYWRFPGGGAGRILSLTDKIFPSVEGDGVSTLGELIRTHPRYRLQAPLFVARHRSRLDTVVPAGEIVPLALAGNHAQGTLFRDGAHLVTPALERRIDEIARAYPGFFVGRFDVRYSDVTAFKAGEDLAIVELNGATSESTNIYDPDHSLWQAYRTLFRQWRIVFEIGAENRRRGARVSSITRLAALVREHLASVPAFEVSD